MDFLTKLYSNDNFGIILFTSISILVLAFLIILFFGKKDQKERKLAETKILNNKDNLTNIKDETSEIAFQEQAPVVNLEVPVPQETFQAAPIMEEPTKIDSMSNVPPIFEAPVDEPNIDVPIPPQTDFDFDALAASISKELESIGVSTEENEDEIIPSKEPEVKVFEETPTFTPILEPIKEPEINQNIFDSKEVEEPTSNYKIESSPIEPKVEEIKTSIKPAQFSSVFVSKKNEEKKVEEPTKIEPVKEPEAVLPVQFEMPKPIDLPKLNTETKEETIPNMSFGSLENDIPTYGNDENRM